MKKQGILGMILGMALIFCFSFTTTKTTVAVPALNKVAVWYQTSSEFQKDASYVLRKVAKQRLDANYNGTSSIEIKRTAFARLILQNNQNAVNKALGYLVTETFITNFCDADTVINDIQTSFDNEYDKIAEAF